MIRTARKVMAGLALGLTLVLPSWAGLFDNNSDYTGFVSAIQSNHFFVCTPNNTVILVMLRTNSHLPSLFAGNQVHVTVSPGTDGNWYLEKLEMLDPATGQPTASPSSVPVSSQ